MRVTKRARSVTTTSARSTCSSACSVTETAQRLGFWMRTGSIWRACSLARARSSGVGLGCNARSWLHTARKDRPELRPVAEAAGGDAAVDTEHVLLGLARVEDGLAARIMTELGSRPARSPTTVARRVETRRHRARDDGRPWPCSTCRGNLEIALLGVAAGALWLVAAALLYLTRRPAEPPVGPRTLELGPEPPAVANFLVNDFSVTDDAVPATLIDLAAATSSRSSSAGRASSTSGSAPRPTSRWRAYERRVLDHLRDACARRRRSGGGADDRARRGLARAGAGRSEARSWRTRSAAGCPARPSESWTFLALSAAGRRCRRSPLCVLELYAVALGILVAVGSILSWIQARHPQRETPEGLAAASRWLGVRAELARERGLPDALAAAQSSSGTGCSPTAPRWGSRAARAARCPWARSRTRTRGARTAGAGDRCGSRIRAGGRPGGALDPRVALVGGIGAAVAGALVLERRASTSLSRPRTGWHGLGLGAYLALLGAAVLFGIALAVMALRDPGRPSWRSPGRSCGSAPSATTSEPPLLRRRRRRHLAHDPGLRLDAAPLRSAHPGPDGDGHGDEESRLRALDLSAKVPH